MPRYPNKSAQPVRLGAEDVRIAEGYTLMKLGITTGRDWVSR
jgi:hypothetical protein